MYAVFTEVNADESVTDVAREMLPKVAVPGAQQAGALAGFWLAPQGGRGVAVVVFDTQDAARKVEEMFQVGEPPMPEAPEGVTVRTVEVREVLASLT